MQTASTCFQTVEQYGVFQKELTPVEARQKSDVLIWVDIGYKHECNPKWCMSNPLTSHGHYDVETCNWTGCTGSSWNADKPSWSRTASPRKTIRTALIFQSGSLVDHEVAEEPSWNSDWCSWSRKLMSLAGPKHLPAVVGRRPAPCSSLRMSLQLLRRGEVGMSDPLCHGDTSSWAPTLPTTCWVLDVNPTIFMAKIKYVVNMEFLHQTLPTDYPFARI